MCNQCNCEIKAKMEKMRATMAGLEEDYREARIVRHAGHKRLDILEAQARRERVRLDNIVYKSQQFDKDASEKLDAAEVRELREDVKGVERKINELQHKLKGDTPTVGHIKDLLCRVAGLEKHVGDVRGKQPGERRIYSAADLKAFLAQDLAAESANKCEHPNCHKSTPLTGPPRWLFEHEDPKYHQATRITYCPHCGKKLLT